MSATTLEWQPLWDAMDARPTEWIETTEQMWWDMLECVPPRAQAGSRFLVGEPQAGFYLLAGFYWGQAIGHVGNLARLYLKLYSLGADERRQKKWYARWHRRHAGKPWDSSWRR